MGKEPVIAVFDIGKTNKKLILFNQRYEPVWSISDQLPETTDEDGFPCEDIRLLTDWVHRSYELAKAQAGTDIRAIHCTAYGASFVLMDEAGRPIAPLYNYLKPYPSYLQDRLYQDYGGRQTFCRQTASPALGSLNSGLQLLRIKKDNPDLFQKIRYALHLPNYISFLLTGQYVSEITSLGCHTHLWDFQTNAYHEWVSREGIAEILPPIHPAEKTWPGMKDGIPVGPGLHDSSAALIPYLQVASEPFVLLSTGTWSISLNPFNDQPLTNAELEADCLCYLSVQGKQVKASRLFAGHAHEEGIKALSAQFDKSAGDGKFEAAYHQLIHDLVGQQIESTRLVMDGTTAKTIFVDGGFSNNELFMQMLASKLPDKIVYAATVGQASALGAALSLHNHWNSLALPRDIVQTRRISAL